MQTLPHALAGQTADSLSPAVIARIRQAQTRWANQPIADRLRIIRRLRRLLVDRQDDLCSAVDRDIQKPVLETLATELLPAAAALHFLEKRARYILQPRKVRLWQTPLFLLGERDVVLRKPRGIVGIIGTWNYPYFLNTIQIAQALSAGNAVIWKPSEVTPRSAQALTRCLRQAGIDEELVLVLPPEREWGPKLAEAAVDHIVFTGHDQTGRKLAARLGERLISSTLELSGHDAVLVLEDADLDLAARAICFAVTVNAGQTCLAARRVFVHRSICADLQRRLKERFQSEPPIRPLARTGQSDQADELVQSALRDGANLLLDSPAISNGQRSTQPIVVTNVRPEMRICHEALFAPVVAVLPFEEITQAVTAIRAGEFGLGLSLFTADLKRAKQLAAQLPAGLVSINDIIAPAAHPETPLGGVGRSGWGSTQGVEGLLEMTVPQVISWRTSRWRPHYDRPGASPFTDPGVLSAMLRWRYDGSLGKRLRSFFSLIRAARIARKNAKQIETQGSGASARPSRKNA